MSAIFVTATGTDIGKTFVTCGLIRALQARGRKVAALKPIMSGFDEAAPAGSDAGLLLSGLGRPVTAEEISPPTWRRRARAAPSTSQRWSASAATPSRRGTARS
jgi:dethiobiotin synthetase